MRKLHYSWVVWLGCALLFICIGGMGINAFAVYQPYILEHNGFTNTQISTLMTVRSVVIFVSTFLTGIYYRHISLRNGMTLAALLMAAAYMLFGLAERYAAYCLAAALVGLSYGFGSTIPVAVMLERWFVGKRTLAMGMCSASSGMINLIFPTLLTKIVGNYGLRIGFFTEAALMALLAVLIWLLVRNKPADLKMEPYGAEAPDAVGKVRRTGDRQLTKKLWILLIPGLLFTGVVAGVAHGHLTMLATSEGFDNQTAALAITIVGLMTMIGNVVYGWTAEKLGVIAANWLFGLLVTTGLVLCCFAGEGKLFLFAGVCAYGIGMPINSVGLTAWAASFSTPEAYDRILRRFMLLNSAGGMIFSNFPGILADLFGGSYVPAYLCFAVFAAWTLICVQWAYGRSPRRLQESCCLGEMP